MGVAAGFGTQQCHGVVGDCGPFTKEGARAGIEEDASGVVGPGIVVMQGLHEGIPESVAGDDVETAGQDERWCRRHCVDQSLHGRPNTLRRCGGAPDLAPRCAGSAQQSQQMCTFCVVESQRLC